MALKEKVVTVYDGEKPIEVKLKEIGWIDLQKIADNCTITTSDGRRSIKLGELKIQVLMKSLIEAPFTVDVASINNQSPQMIDTIYEEANTLSTVDEKKNVKS